MLEGLGSPQWPHLFPVIAGTVVLLLLAIAAVLWIVVKLWAAIAL